MAQQTRSHTLVRPYVVKENDYYVNVVSISLITSDISILSRETLTLPIYPTLSTRAEKREPKNASKKGCLITGSLDFWIS